VHVEFLVEEPSAEAALQHLVPKMVGSDVTFRVLPFQGKADLLRKLPSRLKGYRRWLPDDWLIVVLADVDDDKCEELKLRLERTVHEAGLSTRATAGPNSRFHVLNRLAIEELEAWFFGDAEALCSAYPRIGSRLDRSSRYRDPDAIRGGTWEALERELRKAGYYPGGLPKIGAARDIAAFMVPDRNRSRSFQTFRRGLLEGLALMQASLGCAVE
jgi:hypothetical protein